MKGGLVCRPEPIASLVPVPTRCHLEAQSTASYLFTLDHQFHASAGSSQRWSLESILRVSQSS